MPYPIFVVAFVNYIDGSPITQKQVSNQPDWISALNEAFPGYVENFNGETDLGKCQEIAFSQDWDFSVLEIKQ